MPPEKLAPVAAYLLSDRAKGIAGCTVRAAGDQVGLVTDPKIHRLGIRSGGWDLETLDEEFRDSVANGVELDKSSRAF